MNSVGSNPLLLAFCSVVVAAGASVWGALPAAAQPVELAPGTKTTIGVEETTPDCSTAESVSGSNVQTFWSPSTLCVAEPTSDPPLQVFAISAFSAKSPFAETTFSSLQNLSATARLVRDIEIPLPAEEPFLSNLWAHVATEVAWSGGFVAAGTPSTYAQITGTLQVRDLSTGLVIASNTFFTERFDSELALPTSIGFGGLVDALNQVNAVDVSSSSGADVKALLQRGRTYAIEVEAKCDVGAPAFGFAFCLFAGDVVGELGLPSDHPLVGVFADDGFLVAPFEVTVDSDAVEDAL